MLGRDPKDLSEADLEEARTRMVRQGLDVGSLGTEEMRQAMIAIGEGFRDSAMTSAGDAAKIMLDAVRDERWRVLVGPDAEVLDQMVREAPEDAYGEAFMQKLFRDRACGGMAESETYAHLEHLRIMGDAGVYRRKDGKLIYEI